jgi:hypothetical protein
MYGRHGLTDGTSTNLILIKENAWEKLNLLAIHLQLIFFLLFKKFTQCLKFMKYNKNVV